MDVKSQWWRDKLSDGLRDSLGDSVRDSLRDNMRGRRDTRRKSSHSGGRTFRRGLVAGRRSVIADSLSIETYQSEHTRNDGSLME